MRKFSFFCLLTVSFAALAGCDHQPPTKRSLEYSNAHYWQRADVTSATYMRGPKAQQQLFRDISRCTYEIRELERLGAIRSNTPANTRADGSIPDPSLPEGRLESWDTPEREGYLYAEHSNYHDFETCMQFAGWERVDYLPYDTANTARETYLEAIGVEQRRTKSGEREMEYEKPESDFDNLNN